MQLPAFNGEWNFNALFLEKKKRGKVVPAFVAWIIHEKVIVFEDNNRINIRLLRWIWFSSDFPNAGIHQDGGSFFSNKHFNAPDTFFHKYWPIPGTQYRAFGQWVNGKYSITFPSNFSVFRRLLIKEYAWRLMVFKIYSNCRVPKRPKELVATKETHRSSA